MPGRNRTGPMGRGPMTGRGFGVCSGADVGGYGAGMGREFGFGAGRGCRRGFGGFFTQEAVGIADKDTLTAQKELLQRRLDEINKQLENK